MRAAESVAEAGKAARWKLPPPRAGQTHQRAAAQGRGLSAAASLPPNVAGTRTTLRLDGFSFLSARWLVRHNPPMQTRFWEVDAALVPTRCKPRPTRSSCGCRRFRAKGSPRGGFTALHLRVESDWIEHCKRWEKRNRDNCMSNTDSLDSVFTIEGVDRRQPVYIAWQANGTALQDGRGLSRLAGYTLVSKETLATDILAPFGGQRELLASIDLLVCDAASRFVGNSVSTFSAYLLLRRRHRHRQLGTAGDDFWYNGGSIPLQDAGFSIPSEDPLADGLNQHTQHVLPSAKPTLSR